MISVASRLPRATPRDRRGEADVIRIATLAMAALLLVVVWGLVVLVVYLQHQEARAAAVRQAEALAALAGSHVGNRLERIESHGRLVLAMEPHDARAPGGHGRAQGADGAVPDRPAGAAAPARPAGSERAAFVASEAPAGVTRSQRLRVGDPAPTVPTGSLGVAVRSPVGDREPEVLWFTVDASALVAAARSAVAGVDAGVILIDGAGRVLGSSQGVDTLPAGSRLPAGLRDVADRGVGVTDMGAHGVSRAWFFTSMPRSDVRVGVGVSMQPLDEALMRRAGMLALAAVIESLVVAGLGAIVWRQAGRLAVVLHKVDLSRSRLRVADQAKTHFLQSISHELRTPLNGILPSSELMIQLVRSDEQAEIADMINQSAVEMATMIDTLIDIADLQIGRARLEPSDFDIRRMLDAAAGGFGAAVRSRGGRFAVVVSPTLPERLRCDEARVGRVVRALLEATARIFTRPLVRLEATMASSTRLRLTVRCEAVAEAGRGGADAPAPAEAPADAALAAGRKPREAAAALGLLLIEDLVDVLGGTLNVLEAHPERLHVEALVPVTPASPAHAG